LNSLIILKKISKYFKIYRESGSIKEAFLGKTSEKFETLVALSDVSFEVGQSEILGIIGPNGSGKTTLLKIIAGIYAPSGGEVIVNGKISALLSDISGGFNPELSIKDNIRLYTSMFEKESCFNEVLKFAGIGEFVNCPVKHLSTGMKLRLGFALSTLIEPDILLIDEFTQAGDIEFSRKSRERIIELIKKSRCAVLVSHDLEFIKKFCTKAMLLQDGMVEVIDKPDKVVSLYREGSLAGLFHVRSTIKKCQISDTLHFLKSAIYFKTAGDYNKALEYLEKILEMEPENTGALKLYGWILKEKGCNKEAVTFFEKAFNINENDTETLEELVNLYEFTGDFESAIKFAIKLLELVPDFFDIRIRLAKFYLKIKKYEKAEGLLLNLMEKHILKDLKLDKVVSQLIDIYIKKGEYEKCFNLHETYIDVALPFETGFELARVYLRHRLTEKAQTLLIKLQALEPDNLDILRELANIALDSGNWEEFENLSYRILELDRNDTDTMLKLGKYYIQQGEIVEGRKWFKKAIKIKPHLAAICPFVNHLEVGYKL